MVGGTVRGNRLFSARATAAEPPSRAPLRPREAGTGSTDRARAEACDGPFGMGGRTVFWGGAPSGLMWAHGLARQAGGPVLVMPRRDRSRSCADP